MASLIRSFVFFACVELMTNFMQLCNVLTGQLTDGSREIDILTWMARTAMELVGQVNKWLQYLYYAELEKAGLGYSFDPLVVEAENEFASSIKSIVFVKRHSFHRNNTDLPQAGALGVGRAA
jgi:hypothetical protein